MKKYKEKAKYSGGLRMLPSNPKNNCEIAKRKNKRRKFDRKLYEELTTW